MCQTTTTVVEVGIPNDHPQSVLSLCLAIRTGESRSFAFAFRSCLRFLFFAFALPLLFTVLVGGVPIELHLAYFGFGSFVISSPPVKQNTNRIDW